jgi:dTDP-glucose pyrophosphorylase
MNIVVPLAGKDPRFESRGACKPLVNVEGKPLIRHCIETLDWPFKEEKHKLYFIILKEHDELHGLSKKLASWFPGCAVKALEAPTDGAARTALALEQEIGTTEELMIYLADIQFRGNLKKVVRGNAKAAGVIPTFKSSNPKYSYAVADGTGRVSKVAEKKVISDNASAGLYYYREGSIFVRAAKEMIKQGDLVNNAFYICPTYNYLVGEGVYIAPVEFVADFGRDDFIKRCFG